MFSWLSGALRRGGSDAAAGSRPDGEEHEPLPKLSAATTASDRQTPPPSTLHHSRAAPAQQPPDSAPQPAAIRRPAGRQSAKRQPKATSAAAKLKGRQTPQPATADGQPAARATSRPVGSKRLVSELSSSAAPVVDQPRVRKRPSLLMHEEPGPQLAPSAAKVSASEAPPKPADQELAKQRRAPRRTAAPAQLDAESGPAKRRKATTSGPAKAATPAPTAAVVPAQPQQPPDVSAPAASAPTAGSAARTGYQEQLPVLQPPLELVLPLAVMPPRAKRQRQPPERLIHQPPGRQLASAENRAAETAKRRATRRALGMGGESVSPTHSAPSPMPHSGGGGGGSGGGNMTLPAQLHVQGAAAAAAAPISSVSPVASSDTAHTLSLVLISKVPESPDDAGGAAGEASSRLRPLPPARPAVQRAAPDEGRPQHPVASSAAPSATALSLASAAGIQASETRSVGPGVSGARGGSWLSLQPPALACRPPPALQPTATSPMPAISLPRPALAPAMQPSARQLPATLPMNPFQSTVDAFLNDDDLLLPNPSAPLLDVHQHGMPLPGTAFGGAGPLPSLQGALPQPQGAARGRPWNGRRRAWQREVPIWVEEALRMGLHGPIQGTAQPPAPGGIRPAAPHPAGGHPTAPQGGPLPQQRPLQGAAPTAGALPLVRWNGLSFAGSAPGAASTAPVAEPAKLPRAILPSAPIGPAIILQQLQPILAATEQARKTGIPAAQMPTIDPSRGMTAEEAARAAAKLPKPPHPPPKPPRSTVDKGIDNAPGVHPALQPRRRRGRPRTKGLPALPPGQVMTLEMALKVPPPPGVRPWNWRRQQARAVARQQALAARAEGRDVPQVPTSAAEALLLAAEQQGSGGPPKAEVDPATARAAGMVLPTPHGVAAGAPDQATAAAAAGAPGPAAAAAPPSAPPNAKPGDSGLTGGAATSGSGDAGEGADSRPGTGAGGSPAAVDQPAGGAGASSPGAKACMRRAPDGAEEPLDEAEAEILLGLKPKAGTLVPVKSGKVDERGVWTPDWRRGQTRRIIIDKAGVKHYYVVAGS